MSILSQRLIALMFCILLLQGCSDSSDSPESKPTNPVLIQAELAALEINRKQQDAWNALDANTEAAVNHYPFIRLSAGTLIVFETFEAYRDIVDAISLPNLLTSEWDHTEWDQLEAFQSSPTKVHLAGSFSRINKNGEKYLSTATVRIVTKEQDTWGIKVRSTAPLTRPDELGETMKNEIAAAESAAMLVLKNYIQAWNERDSPSLSELHHYPSLLLQGVDLQRFDTPEDYISYQENTVFHHLDYAEWDHSDLGYADVIQSGIDTVHIAIECENFNVLGESCGGAEKGLWIITRVEDKWGIHARSQF